MIGVERLERIVHAEIISIAEMLPNAFSPRPFHQLSVLAELLFALPAETCFDQARYTLASYSLQWLRGGILDNAITASNDWLSGVSLLLRCASTDPGFRPIDFHSTLQLLKGGLVGRSELSALAAATFKKNIAVAAAAGDDITFECRDISLNIEGRTLKKSTNCLDLLAVMSWHQLLGPRIPAGTVSRPGFTDLLYVDLVRHGQPGSAAIAGILCTATSGNAAIIRHARSFTQKWIENNPDTLFPPPVTAPGIKQFLHNTALGWQLAGSLAAVALVKRDDL
ncbi:hypothetical protein [Gluconobacter sp. GP1]|uniref:hypothetical protein n=1 Tax=Gluconobacter sp. GP1 TaxID=3046423 RepID=UPI00293EAAF2|nr:hypothetical protein [Gluconobacter sp. GP1]